MIHVIVLTPRDTHSLATPSSFYDSFGLREGFEFCALNVKLVGCVDASISVVIVLRDGVAPMLLSLNLVEGCCGVFLS